MTNPRIEQLGNGITRERIAVQTHLFYEPVSEAVTIAFQAQPWLYIYDKATGVAGDFEVISMPLSAIAGDKFTAGVDPVTGADLSNISAAGVVLIVKAAFAAKWDELVAAEAAQAAQPAQDAE